MIIVELDGIEIDHCVSCLGTWLDTGEIDLITDRAGVSSARILAVLESARLGDKTERQCPRCDKPMRLMHLAENLELDHCTRGHGLWFDHGELKALIDASSDGQDGPVALFFSDLYRSELKVETKGDQP